MNKNEYEFLGQVKLVSWKDKIFIRADIPLETIKNTVAHELAYHRDFKHYGFLKMKEKEWLTIPLL